MPPRASWSGSLLRRLLDQPLDGRGGLRTYASPICQAIKRNANAFFGRGCNRIVKTDALYKAAITSGAFIGHDNIEKWARFGTATGKSNNDHDLSFGGRQEFLPAIISALRHVT
jgi:hypothetical protein